MYRVLTLAGGVFCLILSAFHIFMDRWAAVVVFSTESSSATTFTVNSATHKCTGELRNNGKNSTGHGTAAHPIINTTICITSSIFIIITATYIITSIFIIITATYITTSFIIITATYITTSFIIITATYIITTSFIIITATYITTSFIIITATYITTTSFIIITATYITTSFIIITATYITTTSFIIITATSPPPASSSSQLHHHTSFIIITATSPHQLYYHQRSYLHHQSLETCLAFSVPPQSWQFCCSRPAVPVASWGPAGWTRGFWAPTKLSYLLLLWLETRTHLWENKQKLSTWNTHKRCNAKQKASRNTKTM